MLSVLSCSIELREKGDDRGWEEGVRTDEEEEEEGVRAGGNSLAGSAWAGASSDGDRLCSS